MTLEGTTHVLEVRDKDGKLIVDVDYDGTAKYGESYKPTDAAKAFWTTLASAYPKVCEAQKR